MQGFSEKCCPTRELPFKVDVKKARDHARTMKTFMGEVRGEVQKYNIREREN